MNAVIISGRLVKDPEVRYTTGNEPMAIAKFTLAVDRPFKRDNQPSADFPRVVVIGRRAEWVKEWVKKGTALEVVGRLETGSYEKDGVRHYTTDVIADRVEYAMTNKGENQAAAPDQAAPQAQPAQPQPQQAEPPAQQQMPAGFQAVNDDDIPF